MILKPCDNSDAIDFVVSVRNDPETRKQSRRQRPLTWADLVPAPNSGVRETMVAEVDGVKVGYVHLDRLDGTCELSWVIAPAHRQKGCGTAMVREALKFAGAEALAEIKPDNIASILIAERCGFRLSQAHDGLQVWRFMSRATAE
jgi:RimJ/RimL family protein N-acetyltransferase